MAHKHSLRARMRAFHIWQVLGENPWAVARKKKKKADGGFYTGAFDSIPFLNDDAKRTFLHLLLRPGYMIRDYIRGDHERYLSPLSALVIFFSFFALVAALLKPLEEKKEKLLAIFEFAKDKFDFSDSAIDYLSSDTLPEESVMEKLYEFVVDATMLAKEKMEKQKESQMNSMKKLSEEATISAQKDSEDADSLLDLINLL